MGLVAPDTLSRPAVWLVMLFMAAGGIGGGTAAGIKLTTLAEIFRGVKVALNGERPGKSFGIAATWVGIYLLLIALSVIALAHQLPDTPGDQVLFNSISAASNVGASAEALDPDPATAFIYCAVMLIGRFAPLMILWWMTDMATPSDVAVG